MKAIILAAGYATRLYPLTENQPKPLLMVGEKPIIEYIINNIEKVDEVDEIFVVTNDRFHNDFLSWQQNLSSSKKTHVINDGTKSNEDRLGAVGDLYHVLKTQNINDSVLVIAGDNLFDFSLNGLIDAHKASGLSTLALYDLEDPVKLANRFGAAIVDGEHRIRGFEEKPAHPKTSLAATCCYVFSADDCKKIKSFLQTGSFDNPGDLCSWLLQESGVQGFSFKGTWLDIGNFEMLEEANRRYS